MWIGTATEIADQLAGHRRELGITSFTVRAAAMAPAAKVLAATNPPPPPPPT